jgi:DNA/RNA endonuclease YhcR with UshA esterase domain
MCCAVNTPARPLSRSVTACQPKHHSRFYTDSALLKGALVCFAVVVILILLAFAPAPAQKKLSAVEARDHIGEIATVCGDVVSTHYAVSTKGQPTFLNLDKPYPNQIFTVLIWGNNRSKFGTPEIAYKAKHVCVTGKITEYRGTPEIVVDNPKQIKEE